MFSRTAKRRMLAVVAVLAAVFVVAVVKTRLIGQKPFRSWEKADIAQVELTLTPPDQSFALTDAEVGELLPLLQKVVLYQATTATPTMRDRRWSLMSPCRTARRRRSWPTTPLSSSTVWVTAPSTSRVRRSTPLPTAS